MFLYRFLVWIGLLLLPVLPVAGQICTGSLGDPVVNIDFGKGANPGPPLPGIAPGYTYFSGACPNDGYYTILSTGTSCFNNSWHILPEDHTPGDVNGYMMLVNANFTAGVMYTDTVKGLCGGTTYEFAAWALNMSLPSSCGGTAVTPNITFNIETTTGTVLGSYSTGNIAATAQYTWKQYGLFFTTPTGVDAVVLRMTNANPGGCGNDIAIDDITFRPCGPNLQVAFTGGTSQINICEGKDTLITLNGISGTGFNQPIYQWQKSTNNGVSWQDIAGANNLQFSFQSATAAGRYLYRLAVAESGNMGISSCRIASGLLEVIVHELAGKVLNYNGPFCAPQALALTASGTGSFSWTGPAGFTAQTANTGLTATSVANAGIYTVVATNSIGCVNTNQIQVGVFPQPNIQVTDSVKVCAGSPAILNASGAVGFLWYLMPDTLKVIGDKTTLSLNLPASDTPYVVRSIGRMQTGCADTLDAVITVLHLPTADAGPDRYVFAGDSAQLQGKTGIRDLFSWTPATYLSNAFNLSPKAAPPVSQTYKLVASSSIGCGTATDEVLVHVYQSLQVPNAFSPNGDGINDTWQMRALASYPGCRLHVFDRYGRTILKQTNYTSPWDGTVHGKPVPAGMYYFTIDLGVGQKRLSGPVMVIR